MTATGLPIPFDAAEHIAEDHAAVPSANSVKKKKKRAKKKASQPDHTAAIPHAAGSAPSGGAAGVPTVKSSGKGKKSNADSERASVLRLARNKHWKYVSSFHVRSSKLRRLLHCDCTLTWAGVTQGTMAFSTYRDDRNSIHIERFPNAWHSH